MLKEMLDGIGSLTLAEKIEVCQDFGHYAAR